MVDSDDRHWQQVARRSDQSFTVDDNDNSISYSGDWTAIGPGQPIGSTQTTTSMLNARENTVHLTISPAAMATLQFIGTSVSVQGFSISGCTPPMTFTIDDEDTPTAAGSLSNCSDGALKSNEWFSKDNLTSGEHVLKMKMRTTAPQSGEYFILDYIQYTPLNFIPSTTSTPTASTVDTSSSISKPPPPTSPTTTSQPPTPQTVSSQASHTSNIQSPSHQSFTTTIGSQTFTFSIPSPITSEKRTQTSTTLPSGSSLNAIGPSNSQSAHKQQPPDNNNTHSNSNTHSIPIGAIVGAVVGALVLLFAVMFFWRKRRSRTNGSFSSPMNQTTKRVRNGVSDIPNIEVEPFPSSLQPPMVQEKANLSSSADLTSDEHETDTVQDSSATNTELRELVTRLEREVAGMQVRYAQLEGSSTDHVVTSTDYEGQTQLILPPPYYDDTRSHK